MWQLCSFVYVILLDHNEKISHLNYAAMCAASAAGAEGVEIPDISQDRLKFDQWLSEELPEEAKSTDIQVVYDALFPPSVRTKSPTAERDAKVKDLKDRGLFEEVASGNAG